MGDVWTLADIEELDFAAASTLLAIKSKGQSLNVAERDDSDSDDDSVFEDSEEQHTSYANRTAKSEALLNEAFLDKFLDRLAEVFSREKSVPHNGNREDSKHIAATAWVEAEGDSPLTVIVAKNEGLDKQDLGLLSTLQVWLRAVALTGKVPSQRTDRLWTGPRGLLEYSRRRLWYHILMIQNMDQQMGALETRSGLDSTLVKQLRCLCQGATIDSSLDKLDVIIDVAFLLRSSWRNTSPRMAYAKALRSVFMLGRLKAAYECFKSTTLSFNGMTAVVLQPLHAVQPQHVDPNGFRKRIQQLCRELGIPKAFLTSKFAHKYKSPERLHVHAEMQILISIVGNVDRYRRAHRYIGVSKMSCFLCGRILRSYSELSRSGVRRPHFRARPCHGKVYPLWTLSANEMPPGARFSMASAITHVNTHMRQLLERGPLYQPAIAESTAGVTGVASLTDGIAQWKQQYLAKTRNSESTQTADADEDPIMLGQKMKTAMVEVLPADASATHLIPIDFYALPDVTDDRIRECGYDWVPDFSHAWGSHQHDRRFREMTVKAQELEELHGEYRLYWNENPGLC